LVCGLLFLPLRVSFKIPGLPSFSKTEIIILWILIAMLVFHRQRMTSAPLSRTIKFLLACVVLGPTITVFLNPYPESWGSVVLPGHTPHDVVHFTAQTLFSAALPFFIGVAVFRSPGDLRVLLRVLAGAGLVYSGLQVVEFVLSPQLHRWVYGFHPHQFAQATRGEGYRPMVFLGHGLAVSMFTFLAALASAVLWKVNTQVFRIPAILITAWLMVVLVLAKSVSPVVYALCSVPLVLVTPPKVQLRVAGVLAVTVLLYPVLRASDLLPVASVKEFAIQRWGEERGASLMFRFENEALLLERARERIWFGWGGFCRGCVFAPFSGAKLTTFDGSWIVTLGTFGIVGFVGAFGILLFPVLLCWRHLSRVTNPSTRMILGGVALLVGISSFNLIPNSSAYLPFVLAGALYAGTQGAIVQSAQMRARKRAMRLAAARGLQQGEVAP